MPAMQIIIIKLMKIAIIITIFNKNEVIEKRSASKYSYYLKAERKRKKSPVNLHCLFSRMFSVISQLLFRNDFKLVNLYGLYSFPFLV